MCHPRIPAHGRVPVRVRTVKGESQLNAAFNCGPVQSRGSAWYTIPMMNNDYETALAAAAVIAEGLALAVVCYGIVVLSFCF